MSSLPGQVGRYAGDQVANAAAIIKAGQAMGLDARAITIGVMTAMGESQLVNIDRGDAVGPDARGLFQQRANGAWGSYEDRMNPTIAATSFFKALTAVDGYLSLEPTIAAHKVQRNADPYHYAPYWADAVLMVSTLTADPSLLAASICAAGQRNWPATCCRAGRRLHWCLRRRHRVRPCCPGPIRARSSKPSRGPASKRPPARVAGTGAAWRSSRRPTAGRSPAPQYAVDQYITVMPAGMRHDGDRNPPPGALLFWSTSGRAGHVALYLGGGQIASNDIVTDGQISVVPATDIETKWGATYLGWSPPYFPGGG